MRTTLPAIKLSHRTLHGLQGYKVNRILPSLVGDTSIDIFRTHERGLVTLVGPSDSRLVVVWGKQAREHEDDLDDTLPLPWCQIWTPPQIKEQVNPYSFDLWRRDSKFSIRDELLKNGTSRRMEYEVWIVDEFFDSLDGSIQEKWTKRLSNLHSHDMLTVQAPDGSSHTVTANISRLVFLGRVLFELDITVGAVESPVS